MADSLAFILERLRSGAVLHRDKCAYWRNIPFGSMAIIPDGADDSCDCGLREVIDEFERAAADRLGRTLEEARERRAAMAHQRVFFEVIARANPKRDDDMVVFPVHSFHHSKGMT